MTYNDDMVRELKGVLALKPSIKPAELAAQMRHRGYDLSPRDWDRYLRELRRDGVLA